MEQMMTKKVTKLMYQMVDDHQRKMYHHRIKMRMALCELVRHLQGDVEGYINLYDEDSPIYVNTGLNNDGEVLYGIRVKVEKDGDDEHLLLYLYTDGSDINQMTNKWDGWFYDGAYYDGNYGDLFEAVENYIKKNDLM